LRMLWCESFFISGGKAKDGFKWFEAVLGLMVGHLLTAGKIRHAPTP
jgi:hypothetical protein